MKNKSKHVLAILCVSFNFFMMGIQESSLYTILPKYIGEILSNKSLIIAHLNITSVNSTLKCYTESPHYVVVSMIFLSKNLAMLLANPLYGFLIERFNVLLVTVVVQLLGICAALIYAFSDSILMYVIGRIVDGWVSSGLFVAVFAAISKYFTHFSVRGRYYGLGNTLFFISMSTGPLYGAEMDVRFGKFLVYIAVIPMWIMAIGCTVGLYWFVERRRPIAKCKQGVSFDKKTRKSSIDQGLDIEVFLDENGKIEMETPTDSPANAYNQSNEEKDVNDNNVFILRKKTNIPKSVLYMLVDPYVVSCLVEVFIINLSMFSIPTTLPSWMAFRLCSSEVQQGLVWTFGFVGYIIGVLAVVIISKHTPKLTLFCPMIVKIVVGILLIFLPFSRDWKLLFVPIIGMYFSVGVVEQIIFPMTTHLADQRHESNYGIMSSLVAQSLTVCGVISTLSSGPIAQRFGFRALSILIGVVNLASSPLSLIHRRNISVN